MSKVWLVTGSSRGLGRDIVEAALTAGDRVVASARKPGQLDDLRTRFGEAILPLALDVNDAEAARAVVAQAVAHFGRLDVVVNNAGYANLGSLEDMALDDFTRQVQTNFFGTVNVSKAAIPVLREQGHGHIIQIASVGARVAMPGLSAYQAAKFAVRGFSLVLAQELAPLGIKLTIVQPGGMKTDWAGSSMEVLPVSAPYEPTVGAAVALLRQSAEDSTLWQQSSDPVKVAAAVVELANMAEPPVDLLIGADAYAYASQAAAAVAEADARWRTFTVSTQVG